MNYQHDEDYRRESFINKFMSDVFEEEEGFELVTEDGTSHYTFAEDILPKVLNNAELFEKVTLAVVNSRDYEEENLAFAKVFYNVAEELADKVYTENFKP